MNIRSLAFDMASAVRVFVQKAKAFFYSVMLFGYRCPKCNGSLVMASEDKCRCVSCGNLFDPTVVFQRCSECGGVPVLRVRRYQCKDCGSDIQSKFLFDGLAFDADYFRQKMVESRQRKTEQRERVRQMLAESRSADLPLGAVDLATVPGLLDALNRLTAGLDNSFGIESRDEFDLKRYETHIQAHVQDFPISLVAIPPLSENLRKDLIWRFVAVIFLAHAGIIDIRQKGQDIMVIKHETNRKRQDVLGEFEEADGIEGPVGGVEA
jgi:predicted  nucleic acid-binding Zn-ribbon protein